MKNKKLKEVKIKPITIRVTKEQKSQLEKLNHLCYEYYETIIGEDKTIEIFSAELDGKQIKYVYTK